MWSPAESLRSVRTQAHPRCCGQTSSRPHTSCTCPRAEPNRTSTQATRDPPRVRRFLSVNQTEPRARADRAVPASSKSGNASVPHHGRAAQRGERVFTPPPRLAACVLRSAGRAATPRTRTPGLSSPGPPRRHDLPARLRTRLARRGPRAPSMGSGARRSAATPT